VRQVRRHRGADSVVTATDGKKCRAYRERSRLRVVCRRRRPRSASRCAPDVTRSPPPSTSFYNIGLLASPQASVLANIRRKIALFTATNKSSATAGMADRGVPRARKCQKSNIPSPDGGFPFRRPIRTDPGSRHPCRRRSQTRFV